jgi:hypothetical protein
VSADLMPDLGPYRERTVALAARVEAATLALLAAHQAGRLDDLPEQAAAVIDAGSAAAVALADLALTAAVTAALRRPVPALGLLPTDERTRLAAAGGTILRDTSADTGMRLGRLARAETLDAGHRAFGAGLRGHREITGWTRRTSGAPCRYCLGLADGSVLPDSTPMARHKGCTCSAVPVIRQREDRP